MQATNKIPNRLRKLGLTGVVFFTVKGLLWLIVPLIGSQLF